ncbi:hypothetical protein DPMN_194290 [Dreissena polymorpha]|uniref:Secreted protein n=1 Tax=Dreissena polymorpha TaxID=45954 RepID=A0A9D4BG79_DREPO|nr:hypothetical protein DPMN_194290 [Dreissena polymorpha]
MFTIYRNRLLLFIIDAIHSMLQCVEVSCLAVTMATSPAPVTLATTHMTATASGWSAFPLVTALSSHSPPCRWKSIRTAAMTTSR